MVDIGVNKRKSNRLNHIEQVKKKAEQIFDRYFPNPHRVPNESQFLTEWEEYIQDITQTFGTTADYRMAFNQAARTVAGYQKKYHWAVSPPSYLVTHKPKAQLRTFKWLKTAWKINEVYLQWQTQLVAGNQTDDIAQAYRDVVFSFIFHSGYCIPEVIKGFCQKLASTTPLDLQQWDTQPLLPVQIESISYNTNVRIDGLVLTQFNCYLHPMTLALIRCWNNRNDKKWHAPTDWLDLLNLLLGSNNAMSAKQFCSSAVYTCEQFSNGSLSQALLEYQIGRNKSYGLPLENLARITIPRVERVITKVHLPSPTPIAPKDTKETRATPDLYRRIKQCLYKPKELPHRQLLINLQQLAQELRSNNDIDPLVLIEWYCFKLQSCGVSSIRTYHSKLTRNWLYLCSQYPLSQLSSDNLESAYKEAIEGQSTPKAKKYFAQRLKDLHQFAVMNFGYASVTEQYLHTNPVQAHTRAGFVDESLFNALLQHIYQTSGLNRADVLCLQTLCIMSYRCGLRLSELRKLRMKDIEGSQIGWLSIRDSYIGKNKTASALRKVPLFPMLLSHEKDIVEHYFQIKFEQLKEHSRYPFFTLGTDVKLPILTLQVSSLIGGLLKALSNLDHLVFYHLRHSCLSRAQLILELGSELDRVPNLVAYDSDQINKVRALLFGHSLKNGYEQIAELAGHESPDTTIQHYLHFSDWIVANKLLNADFDLTKEQANRLGLNSRRNLRSKPKAITQRDAFSYLNKKLRVKPIENQVECGVEPKIYQNTLSHEVISLPICYRALSLIEQGFNIQDVSTRLRISEQTLDVWHDRAKRIQSMTIRHAGKTTSRHFTPARKHKLLPAPLKTQEEIEMVNQYVRHFKEEAHGNQTRFKTAIRYALENTSTSHSGVYFSTPESLETFINAVSLFIPKSHWRAMTHFIDTSIYKSGWKIALKGIDKQKERTSVGRSKKSKGAVRLEFNDPKTRKSIDNKSVKKSSPAVRYMFHMMGIMMSLD